MRTVKEVSEVTGISVRTLHYYDEIGLLRPTQTTEAGYRLYDDEALERLQQILYFREFDMPLKDIRVIMENPELDKNQLLERQKKILELKKERLERLIRSIDEILKGENRMDFEVFSNGEIEEMYQAMVDNMSEEQKDLFSGQYGSMEGFQKHFMDSAKSKQAQENFQKVVEWYGDKESALEAAKHPGDPQLLTAYQRRTETILKKLASGMGKDVHSFEVKEIVGEYDFVMKQMFQMKDVSALMLETARLYQEDERAQAWLDSIYGGGATKYVGEALEAFYRS